MSEYNKLKICKMCEQVALVNVDNVCASYNHEGIDSEE